MTAPMSLEDFTDDQASRLAEYEAAQEAPESLRERVAEAIMDADYDQATGGLMRWMDLDGNEQDHFRRLADAALAVIAGTS